MSEQHKLKITVAGGYWEIQARQPSEGDCKYAAHLNVANTVVCSVFCIHSAELDCDSLVLDSTYIALNTLRNSALVAQFLTNTKALVDGESA